MTWPKLTGPPILPSAEMPTRFQGVRRVHGRAVRSKKNHVRSRQVDSSAIPQSQPAHTSHLEPPSPRRPFRSLVASCFQWHGRAKPSQFRTCGDQNRRPHSQSSPFVDRRSVEMPICYSSMETGSALTSTRLVGHVSQKPSLSGTGICRDVAQYMLPPSPD